MFQRDRDLLLRPAWHMQFHELAAVFQLTGLKQANLTHMDFARAQIANSCNILNLYQIRNLKSYCGSVLEIK